MKKKTNILVTGAKGQLGKTLNELSVNYDKLDWTFLDLSQLDITNKRQIREVFEENDFDFCINCAAYTNVEEAENEPEKAFAVNAEGVRNLVEVLNNKTVLIHISTDYVFDGEKDGPYTEEDPTNPINVYGKSKLAGEILIQAKFKRHFIIRTSWLYSRYGNNFLKTVIDKLTNGVNMSIDNTQKGSPTSCVSLSRFILYIVKTKNLKFGVYHFTNNGVTNWYRFAVKIAQELKIHNIKIAKITSTASYASKANRPKNSALDTSKTQKIYSGIQNWEVEVEEAATILISEN